MKKSVSRLVGVKRPTTDQITNTAEKTNYLALPIAAESVGRSSPGRLLELFK